ncbi:MAG: hypothetical protein ACREFD_08575 [Stellaceae bacterium]
MANTTIQLINEDTTNLLMILDMMRPTLDAQHGRGFFATTSFQMIRSKFPRGDDIIAPRPREIHLSDIELNALKAALEMNRWMSGDTTNSPIYDKVLSAIEKRAATLVGRLSLSRSQRRANVT